MTVLGVDIGGTMAKYAAVDADGRLLHHGESAVDLDGYATPVLDTAIRATREFVRAHNIRADGVAVSATGLIDIKSGVVSATCGNIPGWEGSRVAAAFGDAFGVPVTVMNDANCALYGEAWLGGARTAQNAVMITIGTGVGFAALVDGRMLNGRRGFAGEGGHFPLFAAEVAHESVTCTCGNLGCYEQHASVPALLRAAAKVSQTAPVNGREAFRRAVEGESAMLAVLDTWARSIAAGLVGFVHTFDPELVLIGGGVCAQEELLIAPVRKYVREKVMRGYRDGLEVRAAALGNSAGMLGAVRQWLDTHGK